MTWIDVLKIIVLVGVNSLIVGLVIALVATSIIDDLNGRKK